MGSTPLRKPQHPHVWDMIQARSLFPLPFQVEVPLLCHKGAGNSGLNTRDLLGQDGDHKEDHSPGLGPFLPATLLSSGGGAIRHVACRGGAALEPLADFQDQLTDFGEQAVQD